MLRPGFLCALVAACGVTLAAADAVLADGSCCLTDGSCLNVSGVTQCIALTGEFSGTGTNCDHPGACGGACCGSSGACLRITRFQCGLVFGLFEGLGTSCVGENTCLGACCNADGSCAVRGSNACTTAGGVYNGLSSDCEGRVCSGACCTDYGACAETGSSGCQLFGGYSIFNGFGSTCDQVACAGACCLPDKSCSEIGEGFCNAYPGVYQGGGTTCATDCPSPVPTTITYQGQLRRGGVPANGLHDFSFALWAGESGGDLVGGPLDKLGVEVLNGLFTVALDFDVAAFARNARWLEASVCEAGVCTALAPRQLLTPAPYALQTRGLSVTP